jgi:hypothetical protein
VNAARGKAPFRLTPTRALLFSVAYLLVWALAWLALRPASFATNCWRGGLFVIGLAWVVWLVERAAQRRELGRLEEQAHRRRERGHDWTGAAPEPARTGRTWNPLDPQAWYYGGNAERLKQSLGLLASYSLVFLAAMLLIDGWSFGAVKNYDLPAGGGGDGKAGDAPVMIRQPAVKVKKVVRKKFVINPYSGIVFNAPPIDKFDPKLIELTREEYQVGQGSGEGQGIGVGSGSGAGFGSGTGTGKVTLVRLQYEGGDWDLNFGPGKDQNMLREYQARTRQPTAERTETITAAVLGRTPPRRSPAILIVGGQRNIVLSKSEKAALREYVLEKRGMLLGDNGGSMQFHGAFIGLMREISGVEEVPVPLDDILHRSPYRVPYLPYVSPHGGKIAYGWKVDGRWVGFYHPGDLGDAWADGHAGVPLEIWEACYRLGTNIIYYAHVEKHKWLSSQKP